MWTRVAKDNLKAFLPFKPLLRNALRQISPYRSNLANDAMALEQGLQLIRFIRDHGIGTETVLEVGTGWIPTIPHMLKAYGVQRIILTDIERLCDSNTFDYARKLVETSLPSLADVSGIEEDQLKQNLARQNIEDYRCPPRLYELPSGSVDLIYSRAVLEHVAETDLKALLREWKQLLRPGGYCMHLIDNSDHFEHENKQLSRLNFLTLSDRAWNFACFNPQNYQNRLRHSDYLKLFGDADYDLVHTQGEPDRQALADLDRLVVNRKFVGYDKEDLAILASVIVARTSLPV